jgi:hypothetical protein
MNSIAHLDPATTTGPARNLFDSVQAKLGTVPNLYRVQRGEIGSRPSRTSP